MPLFRPLPNVKVSSGQLQEVMCPRCKDVLPGSEDYTTVYTDGEGRRQITGQYACRCGYRLELTESYPMINRATDER